MLCITFSYCICRQPRYRLAARGARHTLQQMLYHKFVFLFSIIVGWIDLTVGGAWECVGEVSQSPTHLYCLVLLLHAWPTFFFQMLRSYKLPTALVGSLPDVFLCLRIVQILQLYLVGLLSYACFSFSVYSTLFCLLCIRLSEKFYKILLG